jgi:hypothetical protein
MLGSGNRYFTENHCEIQVDKLYHKFKPNTEGEITMDEFSEKCTKDDTIIPSMSIFDRAI